MLKQLNSTEDGLGLVALEMIIEFLEFYKFDYTIPVLRKEAHYIDPIIRPRLAKKMNVQGKENTLKPLLLTMVQEYNKILDEGLVVK